MGNGLRLKNLLEERGIRVSELSRLTGIAPQTFYAIIKRDNKKIDALTVSKIADVLDIDLPELINYLDSDISDKFNVPLKYSAQYDFGTPEDRAAIEILDSLKKLNIEGKQEAAKRVEELTYIKKYTE